MTGRNDPCPCGSGRKYKRCHGVAVSEATTPPEVARAGVLKARDVALAEQLMRFARRRHGARWLEDVLDAEGLLVDELLPDADLPLVIPWLRHFRLDEAGGTLADEWRAGQGDRKSPDDHLLLDAYDAAWLSIWEVAEVEPGTGSRLKDLLTGEERFVYDVSSSRGLRPFDTMLAIILTCDGVSFFGGAHMQPLPPREARAVLQAAKRLCRVRTRPVAPDRLRDPALQLELLDIWRNAVEDMLHQPPPRLHNTDGDPLVPTSDDFALLAPRDWIARQLASVPGVQEPEPDRDSTAFLVTKPANAMHKTWDNTIIGRIVLTATRLTVETNSTRRADALRTAVEAACPGLLRFRLRKEENTSQLLAAARDSGPGRRRHAEAPVPPEVDALLRQFREEHLRDWVDQALPALDGLTPREAARLPRARPQLAVLLKELAQSETQLPPGQRIDLRRLHEELGFEELLPDV